MICLSRFFIFLSVSFNAAPTIPCTVCSVVCSAYCPVSLEFTRGGGHVEGPVAPTHGLEDFIGLDGPFIARIDFILVNDLPKVDFQLFHSVFELRYMSSFLVVFVHLIQQTVT